jgi:foldase protein PrsA
MPPRKKTTAANRKSSTTSRKSVKKTTDTNQTQIVSSIASLRNRLTPLKIGALLLLLLLALGVVRFRYIIIPATVNGQPIFINSYIEKLHSAAGAQVINQLITEALLNQQANSQGVTVSPSEVEAEIAKIEEQFPEGESLDMMLSSQGMSRSELNEQLTLNLKVQKLLEDKIVVSDEEAEEYYAENKEFFADVTPEVALQQIKEDLKLQKLQQEISLWLDELRASSDVKVFLP